MTDANLNCPVCGHQIRHHIVSQAALPRSYYIAGTPQAVENTWESAYELSIDLFYDIAMHPYGCNKLRDQEHCECLYYTDPMIKIINFMYGV